MKKPTRIKLPMYTVEEYEGESIETKVARMVETNEPISDSAPVVYTEKKDGVRPENDIRTDKWEIAIKAMEKVNKSKIARSKEMAETGEKKALVDKKEEK